jgi:hypothetical protein
MTAAGMAARMTAVRGDVSARMTAVEWCFAENDKMPQLLTAIHAPLPRRYLRRST